MFLIFLMIIYTSLPGLRGDHILEEERVVCCPDHTVVLTCTATFVDGLEWAVAPYIPREDAIKFVINLHAGDFMPVHHKDFLARVKNLSRLNPTTARFMTSTLEVNCSRISNGTIVECITSRNDSIHSVTAAVHHTGVPKWVGNTNTHNTMDPVALELGEMFDGGGVSIDHYIIQLDNGTQLETTNSTYSFDIMYNTTLSVNISAHNCAGYSPFFPLVIQYRPVANVLLSTTLPDGHVTPGSTAVLSDNCRTSIRQNFQYKFILPVIIGLLFITILISSGLAFLVTRSVYRKKNTERYTNKEKDCGIEGNTAHGVTVSRPHYNMENNPLYEMWNEKTEC